MKNTVSITVEGAGHNAEWVTIKSWEDFKAHGMESCYPILKPAQREAVLKVVYEKSHKAMGKELPKEVKEKAVKGDK